MAGALRLSYNDILMFTEALSYVCVEVEQERLSKVQQSTVNNINQECTSHELLVRKQILNILGE